LFSFLKNGQKTVAEKTKTYSGLWFGKKRGYAGDISMGCLIRIYEKHCSAQTEPGFFG
jgi:hypothetical protein